MRWSKSAEEAIAKVPFFVRKRVRKKIESEAEAAGSAEVTLDHVHAAKQRFLQKMEDDVKGYRLEHCFGSGGCPNRILDQNDFAQRIEDILKRRDLKSFLKSKVAGPLKFHHEFSVSLADCPNACSRPQIADVGIIAAAVPVVGAHECTRCGLCAEACQEKAIKVSQEMDVPFIDATACVFCGQCVKACPTETLVRGKEGFRIMIGGKLGRHPRLASELKGIFAPSEALKVLERILDFYIAHNQQGERLGEILERVGIE
ncbi:MAG: 4Fe-4S binding protein [Desulfomonilaceae bacterium]